MAIDRRKFIKQMALGTGAIAATSLFGKALHAHENFPEQPFTPSSKPFNMCGYAAPKLDKVRIGFVGIGDRGTGAVVRMTHIEGVEIIALCDITQACIDTAQQNLKNAGMPPAAEYSGSDVAWQKMCERDDLDLIYICTPWELHTPISVFAMEHNKHVGVEVPAALTVKECWQLVETSEKTKRHCMMLENCCYDFFELLTLNMVRQGYFGEIIHGEGAYIHDLSYWNFNKPNLDKASDGAYTRMWRLKANGERNGNLYPTHGLGPICQTMNINRGDKMDYLTSLSTADFSLGKMVEKEAAKDDFFAPFVGKEYRGNMNTTLIKTDLGRTIMVQHDTSSPRPYSRIHLVSGTEAFARKWPSPAKIAKGHNWLTEEEMKDVESKYTPEIVQRVGDLAKKVGGHGGMDFMMDWRLIDCLRNGLPLDQDVYDAATWSVISPLSEQSVNSRAKTLDVPDFTRGAWKTNAPVELTLKGGGTTGVQNIEQADDKKQLGL